MKFGRGAHGGRGGLDNVLGNLFSNPYGVFRGPADPNVTEVLKFGV